MITIHDLKNRVPEFPVMKTKSKDGLNNTHEKLSDFMRQLKETPQYSIVFYHEIGRVEIWFMLHDRKQCMVSMNNTIGSCSICIQYFVSGQELVKDKTSHTFDPDGFLAFVNSFLTKEALEKQIEFREQETLHEALKKAHYSSPRTCGNSWEKCKYCKSEESHFLIIHGYGT
jgi:hypothetical protein